MRTTKITVLVLLLLFALASIAIGYGLWSKTLTIEGTVNTGDVDAEWIEWPISFCNDEGTNIDPFKDKHVGTTTIAVDPGDSQIIHITVDNGYPSYESSCHVRFHNNGTIPLKVQGWTITPINFTLATAKGADDGELWVEFIDGCGAQLDPSGVQESSVDIHVEQPALENDDPAYPAGGYSFTLGLDLVQWNEFEQALCP